MRLKTFEKNLSLYERLRYISHMNNLIRNIDNHLNDDLFDKIKFDDLFT